MAFPTSPINGQTTTIGGVLYTYNSTKGAWAKTSSNTSTDISAANINATTSLTINSVKVATTGKSIAMAMVFGG